MADTSERRNFVSDDLASHLTVEQIITEDSALLHRIGKGDREALTAVYMRYRLPLLQYLLQLTTDQGIAEDILQETLVAIWHGAKTFAGRSSPKTWIFGIARRQSHNMLRTRSVPLTNEAMLIDLPAQEHDPEHIAIVNATRSELVVAMNQLTLIHREVLVLTFIQELTNQECAAILEVPLGTIKSRLNHAKRALRAQFIIEENRS